MHEKFMKRALQLAQKARPSPNPPVGAVLEKGGRIITEGFHKKAGGPHAEAQAIRKAGAKAKGSTLYVTLEPCSHYGKTPPCTLAIIKAGVKRVCYSARDPTKKVKGREVLQKAGIKTRGGVCEKEGEELIRFFKHHALTEKPYVILKIAQTLDGKIATAKSESKWITSKQSREHARKLRSQADAILVGINTILNDNPHLTSRKGRRFDPLRIILDSKLRIPLDAKALKDPNAMVVTANRRSLKAKILEKKGIQVVFMKKISIPRLMALLGKKNVLSVLIEGGGSVNFTALKEKTVDKILFYMAPKVLGGEKAKTSVEGKGFESIARAIKLEKISVTRIANDILIEATPKK